MYFKSLIDLAKYIPSAILSSNVNDRFTYFFNCFLPFSFVQVSSFMIPIVDTIELVP